MNVYEEWLSEEISPINYKQNVTYFQNIGSVLWKAH